MIEEIIENILNNEKIAYSTITKATSGFTSLVYFVDDKFVIKLSNDKEKIKKINKEISIYKNLTFEFMPKCLASGEYEDYHYLIISKLNGKSLYQIWHTLSNNEKESVIKQIADILKEFNRADGSFLDKEYQDTDWRNKCISSLNAKIDQLREFGVDTSELKQFVLSNEKVFENNSYGLVYNDAHFDNFIYNNGKVYLIDFDRVRYCPIDYEMLIFKTMCDNPSKFASEEDEDNIKDEDYSNIYAWFKKYYKEMFATPNIEQRIKFYQYDYLINQAIKCKDKDRIKKENEILLGL